jgi:phosphatidylglycerophosphate synthase
MERNLTDGERWSRELLDRLRAERFGAQAWARFFDDAFLRARVTRARRPALVRQSRRWGAAGLAAAVPFGARTAASWALWWAMVDWHLGMAETRDGCARPLGVADALTLGRIWAAPVVRRHPAPWLVAVAMASDVADGVLARRAGPTRLGRDLDSTADTLFLDAALRGAVEQRGLDARIVTLERARLLVGTAVTLHSYFGNSQPAAAQANRGLAAALAAGGALLAAGGRPRLAEALIGAASGYRMLTRIRAR